MNLCIILGAAAWVACGTVACGFCFAYYQRKYAIIRRRGFEGDRYFSAGWLVGGAISLLVSCMHGHHEYGWLWPWSQRAKAEAGRAA